MMRQFACPTVEMSARSSSWCGWVWQGSSLAYYSVTLSSKARVTKRTSVWVAFMPTECLQALSVPWRADVLFTEFLATTRN